MLHSILLKNVKLEIVGDGGEREYLENLAKDLELEKSVEFLGHISDEELPKVYERATVFAMPSIAELQSIATMEAMASGRPVVAADAMALPHLVHDGDNGYLFPPDDVKAFADRLLKVLTADQKELDRLSENSLHLIQSHDMERTIKIFEGLYSGETQDENETADESTAAGAFDKLPPLMDAGQAAVSAVQSRAARCAMAARSVRVCRARLRTTPPATPPTKTTRRAGTRCASTRTATSTAAPRIRRRR